MAIKTRVATHYAIRLNAIGVLCVAFGLWGAYDLWIQLPRQEERVQRFQELTRQHEQITERVRQGELFTEEEAAAALAVAAELKAFGGKTPEPPAEFDRVVCWLFILCLPCAPYFFWQFVSARRRQYAMDDEGNLTTPRGTWSADEIADIDMSRWMAKSVAYVVHRDGRRVKLDDHVYQNTHLIVGAIASRLYPEQWDSQASPVKPASAGTPGDGEGSEGGEPDESDGGARDGREPAADEAEEARRGAD